MKFQSTALGVIISFYFYTIVATDGPGNYVCDKDYMPSDLISECVKASCKLLKYARISYRHPVTFDGSSHFDILDATLFATPARIQNMKKYEGGNIGKNRIVIDSMCNLVGLVYVTNQSYKRCVKILDSIDESWSTSGTISNPVPKTYGHDCNSRIFILEETLQYYRNLKQQISTLDKWTFSIYIHKIISTEFAEKEVYLWPIQLLDTKKTPHRIAVDRDMVFMGMMYRQGSQWERCKQIEYVDPEPPRSLDPTKNSIGEHIFENVSAYKCDDVYLSAITINSHMQAACTSLMEDQRNLVGSIEMWPIRREEFSMASITRWNYYVKYDHECNFLGVYLRLNNSYVECEKDESSLHPNKQRPTLTCLNLFPH
ncbi:putative candidate secreted effector protein [Blumeria hordei DH14]|uniref:Putative candidate secreted effector protein n=1 Tax=Blumeria graminis f. sp. hordei (strain DH14) TaxID=546991 RepID=N1JNY4_BLUG1|nr:putative candidate secreted effector protein [Blumeria hordei DH14]